MSKDLRLALPPASFLGRRDVMRLAGFASALAVFAPRGAAAQERALRIVSPWEISGIEPAQSGYFFTRLQIAETLVGADDGGLPQPALAASWALSEDRLTWRFVLRPAAMFHDGTPVTAAAAVRILERARAQPGPLRSAPIESIAADGGTVVIKTTRPFLPLVAFLAHYSTIVIASSSFDESGAVRRIIGSGPYRVTEIVAPLRLEAARFERWDGPAPAIARVSYLASVRGETRALMAEGGQAELVFSLDAPSIERLRRGRRVEVKVITLPRIQVLKLNCGSPFFDQVAVRRAVSLAIDRAGIARAIMRNPDLEAKQFFPPALAEWHVPGLPPLRHDVDAAKRLLAEAGWAPGPDGILRKGERAFRVTLRTFPDRVELPVISAAIQDQLRTVGIDVQVSVGNSSDIPAGHRDGTLDLALLARNYALVPDPLGTMLEDFGAQGGDWGAMRWQNAELAQVLERLGSTADPAERRSLRGRASTILQDELPVLPIVWYEHSAAVNPGVASVTIDPLEISYRITAMRWAG
jgi:peptide/nickel transport system substrate-binding protein